MTAPVPRRGLPLIVAVGVFVVIIGVIGEMIAAFGYRFSVWNLNIAFRCLDIAAVVAAVGGLISLLAALATRPGTQRRGFGLSILGVILAVAAFGSVIRWRAVAKSAPPIHDISTDLADPPQFVAILPLRANAPNSAVWDTSVAAKQRTSYPDIQPVTLPVPPGAAFHIALAAARDMGWAIVATDSSAGRIEATSTSTWFGFKDDVVIRIGPDAKGSRIDVRSESRVGQSDHGTNAARIQAYERRLTARV